MPPLAATGLRVCVRTAGARQGEAHGRLPQPLVRRRGEAQTVRCPVRRKLAGGRPTGVRHRNGRGTSTVRSQHPGWVRRPGTSVTQGTLDFAHSCGKLVGNQHVSRLATSLPMTDATSIDGHEDETQGAGVRVRKAVMPARASSEENSWPERSAVQPNASVRDILGT